MTDPRREAYERHQVNEHWYDEDFEPGDTPGHPDGCFFCGSHWHPSDCCPDSQAQDEYWEE